jgi:hypothetical protein
MLVGLLFVSLHPNMDIRERPVKSNVTPGVMSRILHAERLTSIYGEWPSFHDCEITSVALDRGNHMSVVETGNWESRVPPSLTAKVLTVDFRFPDDPSRKYRLVTLRFHGIGEFYMENFSYQNPVMGIGLVPEPEGGATVSRLRVEWGGTVMGHETEFTCESIEVVSVEPFEPPAPMEANRPMQPTPGSGG